MYKESFFLVMNRKDLLRSFGSLRIVFRRSGASRSHTGVIIYRLNACLLAFAHTAFVWAHACTLGRFMEIGLMSQTRAYPFAPTTVAHSNVVAEESCTAQPILLVDDDPIILELVSTVLTLGGYDVVSASCGAEALSIAQEDGRLDLVLSDVVMPGMNGVQLCEKLKALRPKLKCILMSGYDMGLVAFDRGAHFLPKPFFPHDLLGKMREVLALATC